MIAAGQAAGPDDRRDPAPDAEQQRAARSARHAGPPDRPQRVDGERHERDPERPPHPAASSGICDGSRTVTA